MGAMALKSIVYSGEFPAQMASNAENVSIWWRHHDIWKRPTIRHKIHANEQTK